MASLHHKVKLRKLVKEHMKTRVSWLRDNIVYSEGDINQPELTHGKHGLRIQSSRGRYNDAICTFQITKK